MYRLYPWGNSAGAGERPTRGVEILGGLDIVEGGNLHVPKQGHHLQVEEDLVQLVQAEPLLLVQLVDGRRLTVQQEQAEAHHLHIGNIFKLGLET